MHVRTTQRMLAAIIDFYVMFDIIGIEIARHQKDRYWSIFIIAILPKPLSVLSINFHANTLPANHLPTNHNQHNHVFRAYFRGMVRSRRWVRKGKHEMANLRGQDLGGVGH